MSGTVSLLDRPVYSDTEGDRLLGVSPGTAQRWINGYRRAGVAYPPVVRETATDSRWVTWGEFVEARLLAEFRTSSGRAPVRSQSGSTTAMAGRLRQLDGVAS